MTAIKCKGTQKQDQIDYFRVWMALYRPKSVQGFRFIGMVKDKEIPRIMSKDDLMEFSKTNKLYIPDAHNAWLNFDQWMQRRPVWSAETGLPHKIPRGRIRDDAYLNYTNRRQNKCTI